MEIAVVGVLNEQGEHERRVALVPAAVTALVAQGLQIAVQAGAGDAASYGDAMFRDAGATVLPDAEAVIERSAVLATVGSVPPALLPALGAGHTLVGFHDPLGQPDALHARARTGASIFAFEFMPRITRAQSMDALSSQATVAGYHAVLLAAERSSRLFPLLMTAAGTVKARRVLVLGAGVAGLQAIATARRLGAVVTAFDVRPAVKEQVESLGARFLAIDVAGEEQAGGYATGLDADQHHREQEALARACADADVVIATAQIPGAPAPQLITRAAVEGMSAGSVIVDLAAATGGNCELTEADREVVVGGVLILGPSNPAAAIPGSASDLYAANVRNFLQLICSEGRLVPDWDDEVVAGALVARDGAITAERVLARLGRQEAGQS
jgi:NAD(P) transhydrogenase subunit alpha